MAGQRKPHFAQLHQVRVLTDLLDYVRRQISMLELCKREIFTQRNHESPGTVPRHALHRSQRGLGLRFFCQVSPRSPNADRRKLRFARLHVSPFAKHPRPVPPPLASHRRANPAGEVIVKPAPPVPHDERRPLPWPPGQSCSYRCRIAGTSPRSQPAPIPCQHS